MNTLRSSLTASNAIGLSFLAVKTKRKKKLVTMFTLV